jgi:hypothetical protein
MALKSEQLYLVSFFFIPSPCFSLSLSLSFLLLPVGAACSNFFAFVVVVAAVVVVVVVVAIVVVVFFVFLLSNGGFFKSLWLD